MPRSFPTSALRVTARRAAITAALAAVLAAVPGAARASDVVVTGSCFAEGQRLTLTGNAFTANAPVLISGGVSGITQADPIGSFSTVVVAPDIPGLGPRTVRITATDGVNAANATTLAIRVVEKAYGSNLPLAGRPRETTTWRFAGFAPRRPIYGHFVHDGRSHGDHRFGVARGVCGTLTVRAPRVPGVDRLRPGRWTLKLDQRMTYDPGAPGTSATFRIARRAAGRR